MISVKDYMSFENLVRHAMYVCVCVCMPLRKWDFVVSVGCESNATQITTKRKTMNKSLFKRTRNRMVDAVFVHKDLAVSFLFMQQKERKKTFLNSLSYNCKRIHDEHKKKTFVSFWFPFRFDSLNQHTHTHKLDVSFRKNGK